MQKAVEEAANFFRNEDNFCLLCHKNLDGDTIGASFAIFYALKGLGKNVVVRTFCEEYLKKFEYLYPKEESEIFFKPKHYVAVDVADYSLLEKEFLGLNFSLVIDHHESNRLKGKILCVDKNKAASCEVTYLILKELKINFTKKIADCIYTGLATDTGCFKYSNTTAFSHKLAAELIEKGANIKYINFEVLEKKSVKRLELEKYIFNNLEYYFEGKVVLVFVGKNIIEKVEASKEDYVSLSNVVSCIEGVFVAITALQEKDLKYKISVRTRYNFDGNIFCKNFGGGGHKKAAGCIIKGDEISVRKKILKVLEEEI